MVVAEDSDHWSDITPGQLRPCSPTIQLGQWRRFYYLLPTVWSRQSNRPVICVCLSVCVCNDDSYMPID